MLSLKKDKKEEEDKDGGNQYSNLEKTSVLQEARYEFANTYNQERSWDINPLNSWLKSYNVFRLFNETPVNPRKCTAVLAKILFLLNQGEVTTIKSV